jgi:branched-subunit amino acid transport protein AzlD
MAYEAMFTTISPFLVIYDNTSKASINMKKLTKIEPLTLFWMLTIIQTPLEQTFPFLIFSSYVHS